MSTPFPGMDPYLELRPRYRVAIEQYSYLPDSSSGEEEIGYPDVLAIASRQNEPPPASSTDSSSMALAGAVVVSPLVGELPMPTEIVQRYLEVRTVKTREVVTVMEILSPANKTSKAGREQYNRKRLKILKSMTNLVEIDLLRVGKPLPMKVAGQSNYRIVISRSWQRPRADVYLFSIREPIPDFSIPLRQGEPEPTLPLNKLLHELYDQANYDLTIDYQDPPEPQLLDEDAEWAKKLLSQNQS